ncbi:MAG: MFS transporter, partial [Lachnospiraceae bacterium]|nr:MFS transporter [Lachnospiraceae bacterium]
LPVIMSLPTLLPEIGTDQIGAAGGLITTVMMGGAFLLPSYVITPLAGGINNTAFLLSAFCGVILAVIFVILPNASIAGKK